ncbi:pesticidal crystal cry8Ba protein [Thalictrum thalictroides]|uniref:Pesticidal crystal cry8Ba protein n=1 Tax=Thalictrum thalictroides TaxID=46969 RepID=A0A7J6VMV1_THATH|nr:pesticidal crystal cry8Ba protein [Thalictrum thalictroides]
MNKSYIRSTGRGVGLPPPAKFRSGHLSSGIISMPRVLHEDPEDSGFGTDIDEITDSEEEVYGGRYSLDSSPQNDRNTRGLGQRKGVVLSKKPHYGSDSMYSDFSSSRETIEKGQGNASERIGVARGRGHRYVVGQQEYTDDESSDSAMSSEVESTRVGSNTYSVRQAETYTSDGYTSGVPSRVNVKTSAEKDFAVRRGQNRKLSDNDVPSAPPLCDSGLEAKHGAEQNLTSKAHGSDGPPCSGEAKVFDVATSGNITASVGAQCNTENKIPQQSERTVGGAEAPASLISLPARLPTFHASARGPWCAVISYDACVRLCLHLWAKGCVEAPIFLENECELLRNAFGLQQVLLQSEEELLAKQSTELISEGAALKPKKVIGKIKVQVRKVKMSLDPPSGCSFSPLQLPIIKVETLRYNLSSLQSTVSSGFNALSKVRVAPRVPANGSFSRHSLAYVSASTQYIKQVSGLLKVGVTTLRNSSSSYDVVQEKYCCLLRLKSSTEEDAVRMPPGSGEAHIFFPDSLGDDLIIEVQDSKGKYHGRVLAQLATIIEDTDKLRWWSIYREPEHELVGKLQLHINYSTNADENSHLKCGSVAETGAYDMALEVAMKLQHFQQRNLLLHDPWKWLLTEFASYYGVSDVYTRLRYLSYVMDVATPTADCLNLVHDLLLPVIMKGQTKSTLSHQENRILGEIKDQTEKILALVFENYKSLDESLFSGMMDVFRPATGSPAPALVPAIKLYTSLHDILSPEAQLKLCSYFQVAAKKRSRRLLAETDEFVTNNHEGALMDTVTLSTAYQKMKSLCLSIRNEVSTDIDIHNHHVLPSFIDLPNISSSIYSVELCNRLRAFLVACPPTGPSPPVVDLVIAAADFQRGLASWNINPVKGGVDAKELFHLYIILWIQDKRLSLLESCKLDKVKWSGVKTQQFTTPFVDDMYDRLKETLNEYENIVCRWPEYTFALENAIADVEKAIVEALEKQYADVLSPLKDNLAPKKFGLKYIQKLAKRSDSNYVVPEELGVLLNSMKRMLDVLRPRIENQLKSWGSCIPNGGSAVPGERLSEITVMLRTKFRNYLQAVVEKLAENSRLQGATKLKKIIQDSKETVVESDVRSRMQPLKDQLSNTIDHLHTVFETHVFVAVCRGYWDQMGKDVSSFLENRKENRVWYKGSRITVAILDDTFASQMQQLLGNSLQEKDLEPPRSIMEVRAMLCKDAPNHKDSNYYY